jgi:exodeoxyribonuclease V alpha subunit
MSLSQAQRIVRRYGGEALSVVQTNPYQLVMDVKGVGFATADRIALSLGFSQESEARAEASVLHVLRECAAEGHVYYPKIPLIQQCQKILQIDRQMISRAIDRLVDLGRLVVEEKLRPRASRRGTASVSGEEGIGGQSKVYLRTYYTAERGVSEMLRELQSQPRQAREIDVERAVAWVQKQMEIKLEQKQLEAVRTSLSSKVSVITGGPGTGKTTVIRSLMAVLSRAGFRPVLAAPTGRGARRMREATGCEAVTVHRLLEYNPAKRGFQRNRGNPLECDWLILDEASMVNLKLMYRLLKALPSSSSLVLVGDANQLPSIGAGDVLRDIILSRGVPAVELNEVFRQAEASRIVLNAHRIHIGLMPEFNPEGDFFFIRREQPEAVLKLILELCRDRIPRRFNMDPVADLQVLAPMYRGAAGVTRLNRALQDALNPGSDAIARGDRRLKISDKVMQLRNNYEKEVFNGDIGRIVELGPEKRSLTVSFDGRPVSYDYDELAEITLAYAISVHKAQGSEFPAVIISLLMQHYPMLQRNLLYTAVTRARRLAVLVGDEKALAVALRNTESRSRYTDLQVRLAVRSAEG